MSTRCNLIVEDENNRIQLYRHWDGYPDGAGGVLVDLNEVLPYAWPNPRFQADDFAAAIVRAWKEGGGNIYIDGSPRAWEMVHADAEWVYLIKPEKRARGAHRWEMKGPPMVEVYDWHQYWFGKADPNKVKPKPILKVGLFQAKKAGLAWEDKGS